MFIHVDDTILEIEHGTVYEFKAETRYSGASLWVKGSEINGDAAVAMWARLCALADAPASAEPASDGTQVVRYEWHAVPDCSQEPVAAEPEPEWPPRLSVPVKFLETTFHPDGTRYHGKGQRYCVTVYVDADLPDDMHSVSSGYVPTEAEARADLIERLGKRGLLATAADAAQPEPVTIEEAAA